MITKIRWSVLGLLIFSYLGPYHGVASSIPFTVLHTNDLHSHVEGSGPDHYFSAKSEEQDPILGHYARLITQIKQIRSTKASQGEPVLLLDSGDFYSGTLFHILGPNPHSSQFPELEFFKSAGYDAFTLGNHEFDDGEKGLSYMLQKARQNDLLSGFVVSNHYFRTDSSPLSPILAGVPRFLIKEIQTKGQKLKVGIIGLVGGDAARVSSVNRPSLSFYGYDDDGSKVRDSELFDRTQKTVDQLRNEMGVDIVIALFHGGEPEDQKLASEVKGIDLIVAGHTHQAYLQPKKEGETWIVQAGSFGKFLGRLEFNFVREGEDNQSKGHLELRNPESILIPINSNVEADSSVLKKIDGYKQEIGQFLTPMGFAYDSPIAWVNKTRVRKAEDNNELGILVTSGILDELNRRVSEPVDFYFTSLSLIREDMVTVHDQPTQYQFSDIFRMLSIGFADDGVTPGSPLVSFYLKRSDVIQMMNFMEIYRHISSNFTPAYSSSLKYRVRSWGIPFLNRLADLQLHDLTSDQWPELVHVATNAFVAGFFSKAAGMSYGWIDIALRNRAGEVIPAPVREPLPSEAVLFSEYLKKNPKF